MEVSVSTGVEDVSKLLLADSEFPADYEEGVNKIKGFSYFSDQ